MSRRLYAASTFCVAAALLIDGCSHGSGMSQSVLPAAHERRSTSGGPFKANYSGYSRASCYGAVVCDYDFRGAGHGTFIRGSNLISADARCQLRATWSANITIQSRNHPVNELYLRAGSYRPKSCAPPSRLFGGFTVTGGSGKFANAAGSGAVTIHVKYHAFKANFSGNLTF